MKKTENKTSQTKELLDIRSDPVFKAVFTKDSPESLGALTNLVSALIGFEITIVKIAANEPPIENLRDRQVRFDMKGIIPQGTNLWFAPCTRLTTCFASSQAFRSRTAGYVPSLTVVASVMCLTT